MWDTQWAEALAGRVRSGKSVRMCCGKWAMLSRGLGPTPPGFDHAQPCHHNSFSAHVNCDVGLATSGAVPQFPGLSQKVV